VDEVGLEPLHISGVVEEEEVAVEAEVELLTHLLLESLQPLDRLDPDADVQLVREERATPPAQVPCRAGGERLALQ
jgi:hypothetical protein